MPGKARHTPLLSENMAVRMVTCDTAMLLHVGELIGQLTREYEWYEDESTIEAVLLAAWQTLESWYDINMIGQISHFVSDAPPGWLEFDGSTYDGDDYPELFDKLPSGWITGSDFTLPDLQDVFLAGSGSAGTPGATGGDNSYELTVGQLPAHSHLYTPPSLTIEAETPTTPLPTAGIGTPTQTGNTGDGDSVDNRPSFLSLVVAIYAGRE